MLKTLSTIFLSFLCFASLCLGIMFSACPVIPYVKYYSKAYYLTSNYAEFDNEYRFKGCYAYQFTLTGVAKRYELLADSHDYPDITFEERLDSFETYSEDDRNILFNERRGNYDDIQNYEVSNNKKEFSGYKAKFNPTFIFYFVSAGALAGIIAINIPKKKKDE